MFLLSFQPCLGYPPAQIMTCNEPKRSKTLLAMCDFLTKWLTGTDQVFLIVMCCIEKDLTSSVRKQMLAVTSSSKEIRALTRSVQIMAGTFFKCVFL